MREEAEENNLSGKVRIERWRRWHTCSLCEQEYHGVVRCALGWACWKTYLGRPETDPARNSAMNHLVNGLNASGHYEDALSVQEAALSMKRRLGASEKSMLVTQGNLSITYEHLGRTDDSLRMKKAVYAGHVRLFGDLHEKTFDSALNLSIALVRADEASEAMSFTRRLLPLARRALGADHGVCLRFAHAYVHSVMNCAAASRDELIFAEKLIADTVRRLRRVFGIAHPNTARAERDLVMLRERLARL